MSGSTLGAGLHELVSVAINTPDSRARDTVTIILGSTKSRKATRAHILQCARRLSYIHRVLNLRLMTERQTMRYLFVVINLSFELGARRLNIDFSS